MGEFTKEIYRNLPLPRADFFDEVLYDEKPNNRRYNKTMSVPMDADMYAAIQDLVANKDLPFSGNIAAFGRHVMAAGIESLREYLEKDTRTLWSALQSNHRRLTAERYVVTVEEQVRETAELLQRWTEAHEWSAVLYDIQNAVANLDDLPHPAWKRRVAREWLSNVEMRSLLLTWEKFMPEDAPETWRQIVRLWQKFQFLAEGA